MSLVAVMMQMHGDNQLKRNSWHNFFITTLKVKISSIICVITTRCTNSCQITSGTPIFRLCRLRTSPYQKEKNNKIILGQLLYINPWNEHYKTTNLGERQLDCLFYQIVLSTLIIYSQFMQIWDMCANFVQKCSNWKAVCLCIKGNPMLTFCLFKICSCFPRRKYEAHSQNYVLIDK